MPLYVATDKPAQGSIILLHSNRQKPVGSPSRTIKTQSQALQELRECKEDGQPVWVYIYKHIPMGYFATYDGVNCFIPFFQSGFKYQKPGEEENLVNTWCQADVMDIGKDEKVRLSVKKYLKAQFRHEAKMCSQNLKKGMVFSGLVKAIKDDCILLLGHHLHGLLHIDNVIPKHLLTLPDELKQRQRILRSIFMLNRPVIAIVNSISSDDIVTLTWDKELPANAEICAALCEMGIRC